MRRAQLSQFVLAVVLEAHRRQITPIAEPVIHRVIRQLSQRMTRPPKFYTAPIVFSGKVADTLSTMCRNGLLEEVYRSDAEGVTHAYKLGYIALLNIDSLDLELSGVTASPDEVRATLDNALAA